jgi:hypothetical protein
MRFSINLIAIFLLFTGVIWTLQAANVIGGDFMTDHTGLYIGIAFAIVGLGMLVWNNLLRQHPAPIALGEESEDSDEP